MKTYILIALFFSTLFYSQANNQEKYNELYPLLLQNLTSENWEKSNDLTKEILEIIGINVEMKNQQSIVRYMFIYTTAGLMNEKKITKEEALKRIQPLVGKEMIMPAHLFNSKCFVNCTQINDDKPDTFFTAANNTKGTQIFCFEYVKIKDGIRETKDELEGKFIKIKGILDEINVDGNLLPRFKLKFIDGEYTVKDK